MARSTRRCGVVGLTFLGPLLGSLFRPVGGALADRFGGAQVSAVTFATMAAGAAVVLAASRADSLPLFLVGFIVLFVLTGIGNGSVYKMIPAIFRAKAALAVEAGCDRRPPSDRVARRSSRALIGIAGAIGAFGGVGVNLALRQSFLSSGTGDAAYGVFIGFFVVCLLVDVAGLPAPVTASDWRVSDMARLDPRHRQRHGRPPLRRSRGRASASGRSWSSARSSAGPTTGCTSRRCSTGRPPRS